MSAPAPTSSVPTRGVPVPGRRQLLGAVALVAFGSMIPWLMTGVGSISGLRGAGLWTFYAAMLGLAGALVPHRTLRLVQGSVMAVVALVLPVWQVVHVLTLVGTGGWWPGPGLVLVFAGGVVAALAVRRMATTPTTT